MNIYSIHDSKASMFLPLFLAHNDGHATRMFIGSLGDSFTYRADYTLHCLGDFDEDTGEITTEPRMVMSGLSIDAKLDPRPAPIQQEPAQ